MQLYRVLCLNSGRLTLDFYCAVFYMESDTCICMYTANVLLKEFSLIIYIDKGTSILVTKIYKKFSVFFFFQINLWMYLKLDYNLKLFVKKKEKKKRKSYMVYGNLFFSSEILVFCNCCFYIQMSASKKCSRILNF